MAVNKKDDVIFRGDLLVGVACAPKTMKRADVLRRVNSQHPTGISSRWVFSKKRKLADGTKLPAPCLDVKGRVHYMLEL